MAGSTIVSDTTETVTLGSALYASPLTITSTGTVAPGGDTGAAGVVRYNTITSAVVLYNAGSILGGAGTLQGGDGVEIQDAIITNTGIILGGVATGVGGTGGHGIDLLASATLTNFTTITAGAGYYGGSNYVSNDSTLVNNGLILGGDGIPSLGTLDGTNSNAGAGVSIGDSGVVLNNGTIIGGDDSGGVSAGASEGQGILINNGLIEGGTAAGGSVGAVGVFGTILNDGGTIIGTDLGALGLGNYFYNSASGLITGAIGIGLIAGGSIVNLGTIIGTAGHGFTTIEPGLSLSLYSGAGVYVDDPGATSPFGPSGGTLTQVDNYGLISGTNGVVLEDGGFLGNGGTIAGSTYGVQLKDISFAFVANGSTATISGAVGIDITNAASLSGGYPNLFVVENFGVVAGTTAGIVAAGYGLVLNEAQYFTGPGPTITGGSFGIEIVDAPGDADSYTTIINAGTIIGNIGISAVSDEGISLSNAGDIGSTLGAAGTAVAFGNLNDLLTVYAGAVFTGTVSGGGGDNEIVLAGYTAGTLTGLGSQFISFQSVDFEEGATWVAAGDEAGLAAGQTITGFAQGDTIILDGFTETGFTYVPTIGLELVGGDGTTETINIEGSFSTSSFIVFDHGGNTEILLCYLRGTRIATPRGQREIETLQAGDAVTTADGRVMPISWAGSWSVDLDAAPRKENLLPVRIGAGALADGVPARDLYVSPDHGIYLDGALIPARLLVNGVSITQPQRKGVVEYFHIQIEPHDIVLAEGAAAESFLDLGHTSFTKSGEEPRNWEDACAPLLLAGPQLEHIKARLEAWAKQTVRF